MRSKLSVVFSRALASSVVLALTAGASAQSTLDIYSTDLTFPYGSNDASQWYAQSYRSLHYVEATSVIGNQLFLAGHNAFGLDESGWIGRALYYLFGAFTFSRFQSTNSAMFAHEMAHFSNFVYLGVEDPGFIILTKEEFDSGIDSEIDGMRPSVDLGRKYSFLDSYLYFLGGGFFTTDVVAATATGQYDESRNRALTDENIRFFHFGEGVNTQTWLSDRMAKDFLVDGVDFYRGSEFSENRSYPALYPRINGGDYWRIERGLAERLGGNPESYGETILIYTYASWLLSPMTWADIRSDYKYIVEGLVTVNVPSLKITDSVRVTYDLATYVNFDSFTLAPTLYTMIDTPMNGIDKMIVGLGAEFAVIGSDFEPSLYVRVLSGKIDAAVDIALGGDFYIEPELRYSMTDRFDLLVGGAFSTGGGTSLRSRRLNQFNQALAWVGIGYRFE